MTFKELTNTSAVHIPSAAREFVEAYELLYTWARREFRIRYSQSLMGAAWAVLQPLALMVIFTIVFSRFLRVPTGEVPYPVFSYVGLLAWTFFANSLTFAIPSLVNNMNLVSKIYFPREILPISSIMVAFIDTSIAAVLFVPMLIVYQVPVGWSALLLPVILMVQIVFTLGVSLWAAAINVFYRDVRFVVPLALQIWMYLSPVIYPTSQVPEWVRPIYFLNPMAVLIDSYRRILLFNQMPDWPFLGLAALISVTAFILAYRHFKGAERQFADVI